MFTVEIDLCLFLPALHPRREVDLAIPAAFNLFQTSTSSRGTLRMVEKILHNVELEYKNFITHFTNA